MGNSNRGEPRNHLAATSSNRSSSSVMIQPMEFSHLNSDEWEVIPGGRRMRSEYTPNYPEIAGALLDKEPSNWSLTYPCPNCNKSIWDGGLCKKIICECGNIWQRTENSQINSASLSSINQFDNNFDEHCIRPSSFDVPELVTLTLGIFKRGLPNEIRSSDNLSFRMILQSYLNPYFTSRVRCVGIGDFFRYGDGKFKVLGANPSYGRVSNKTLIQCSSLLDENPMLRFQILPIGDLRFTLETFQNGIQPYFRSMPRHIHEGILYLGQFLYLNNTECVVVASQPDNGVVINQTEVYFEGDALYRVNTVTLAPYIEDLPMPLQRLSNADRMAELLRLYIMPYFKGQRRIVSPGRDIIIDKIGFAVLGVEPGRGIIQDNSFIKYEGNMINRAVQVFGGQLNPDLILSRHPGALRDPRVMLIRQILQLQEMLQAMGHPQTNGATPDVIDTLPTHRIQFIPDNPEMLKCMICLCDYEIGEEVRTLPCCNIYLVHIFHMQCIDEWLSRNKLCPICKTPCDVLPM